MYFSMLSLAVAAFVAKPAPPKWPPVLPLIPQVAKKNGVRMSQSQLPEDDSDKKDLNGCSGASAGERR